MESECPLIMNSFVNLEKATRLHAKGFSCLTLLESHLDEVAL